MSKKPFRKLSCNSNIRTSLEPEDDREVLRRIVSVKLKDDIHNHRRTEWVNDGVKGTRQSDIQAVNTSPEE